MHIAPRTPGRMPCSPLQSGEEEALLQCSLTAQRFYNLGK